MKKVLIVSPLFPPVNAPDMQRVRMSLGYFAGNGWEPTVMTVDEQYVSGFRDDMLLETIPGDVSIIKVAAYPEQYTRKVGLGAVSFRSLLQYKKAGNKLFKQEKFDLVFFSTSQHHVIALGRVWKKKFGIPFIADMQDPWRNDFHIGTPKYKNSFKYRLFYKINKYMEAYAMPYADGLMAVSQAYIDILKTRYPAINDIPAKTISFGASVKDFDLVKKKGLSPAVIDETNGKINVVYMGAVTPFFIPVIRVFFQALLDHKEDLDKFHFYFIGTSYAQGSGIRMVAELGKELGIGKHITEEPDRAPYFNAIATLQAADVLFIPGSVDKDYNASKVYNNILAQTPIFSIFHRQSSVIAAVEDSGAGVTYSFNDLDSISKSKLYEQWRSLIDNLDSYPKTAAHEKDYTADEKTRVICGFFDEVLAYYDSHK